jgi:hypothetical protein
MLKKITLCMCMALTVTAYAQKEDKDMEGRPTKAAQKIALGYHLTDVQNSFGVGLNITSPYFWESMAIRLRANMQFLQHIPTAAPAATVWSPYGMLQLGLVGGDGIVKKNMRFYGEGGVVFIMPNDEFSANSTVGGYGLFGFEFFLAKPIAFHIEMGGMGTGGTAEKSVGKPIYANGFLTNVGVRLML